ncbi:hypothetical protein Btru_030263 [Bulinus truncatus]|nr:hypothetical protein Btru_030263 [Bulinus truncatus]
MINRQHRDRCLTDNTRTDDSPTTQGQTNSVGAARSLGDDVGDFEDYGNVFNDLFIVYDDKIMWVLVCANIICRNEAAKEVEAKFGPVSLLVNNAGVVFGNSILSSDPTETEMTFRTNTLAHFWTVRAFLPGMIKQNKGHIVAVSSMLGLTPLNGAGDYCSSKFAASGFMESLREELKSLNASGITVTTVYPYHVDNNMFAGISTRFPALFPAINEDYLAHKIVDAILTNREKVIVPKLMYFVAFFYSIAPVSAIAAIMRFTGVHKAMDQFKQHHKKP